MKLNFKKINKFIAINASKILTSMFFFWILNLFILIPLIFSHPATLILWVSFLCSTWFQAIALPILGFVQNIEAEKTRKLLQEELKLLKESLEKQKK